jgi:FkbM family methyltransferase
MTMQIAGRPLGLILRTATDPAHLAGLARGMRVYRHPFRSTLRYATSRGSYPRDARVRTPLGERAIRCRHWHDAVTVHEVFARHDYAVLDAPATVLDAGANIGVTALWALTRRPDARVACYEPVEENLTELRRNLAGFEERYEVRAAALAARSGDVSFSVEPFGRYGGIDLDHGTQITVPAVAITEAIDEWADQWGSIDLLKLDVEGAELEILAGLDAARLAKVRAIAVEHAEELPADLIPAGFERDRRLDIHYFRARSTLAVS